MESTIVMRSVSALKCYENNPRHNENAVEKVAESIKEFGFLVPIVIDTNDVIIAGETRLKASKLLQLDKVPCIIADELTDEQIKAFRLIENTDIIANNSFARVFDSSIKSRNKNDVRKPWSICSKSDNGCYFISLVKE